MHKCPFPPKLQPHHSKCLGLLSRQSEEEGVGDEDGQLESDEPLVGMVASDTTQVIFRIMKKMWTMVENCDDGDVVEG